MEPALSWSTVGPMLLGGLAVVIWSLIRAPLRALEQLRRELAENYPRKADLVQLEERLRADINQVSFRFDRHEENSTARWLHLPNNPSTP